MMGELREIEEFIAVLGVEIIEVDDDLGGMCAVWLPDQRRAKLSTQLSLDSRRLALANLLAHVTP